MPAVFDILLSSFHCQNNVFQAIHVIWCAFSEISVLFSIPDLPRYPMNRSFLSFKTSMFFSTGTGADFYLPSHPFFFSAFAHQGSTNPMLPWELTLICFRWIPGKIRNHCFCFIQIKDFKNRVIRCVVMPFYNGICHTAFFDFHIVFKYCLPAKSDSGICGTGLRNFNIWISLHIFIYFFCMIGTKPQFPVFFKTEHKGSAFCFSISSSCCKILHWICL